MGKQTTLTIVIVTVAALAGCKKKEEKKEVDPKPQVGSGTGTGTGTGTAVAAAPDAAAAKPAGPRGRKAEGNDAKLVELTDPVTSCTMDPAYPKNACREQVNAVGAVVDPENAAHVATVVAFLEDEAAQVRALGAAVIMDKYILQKATGRAHAARILAAAKAETDGTVAALLGEVLLHGDFKDAAYADGVAELAKSHLLPEMRAAVISNLAIQDEAKFVPFLQERYAAEADANVKASIIGSFYTAQDPSLCVWKLQTFMSETDPKLVGKAAYGIVWVNGRCKAAYDSFAAAYAEKVTTFTPDFTFVLDTAYMTQAKDATPEQHKAMCDAFAAVAKLDGVEGMAKDTVEDTVKEHCK